DRINSPWVRARLDISQAARNNDPCDWIISLGHRISSVVLNDDVLQGESIRWSSLADALRKVRFDRDVTIYGAANLEALHRRASSMLEAEGPGDEKIAQK